MKRLGLLRHAKSDWNTGAADFDRPLNARGRAAAAAMAPVIAEQGFERVLASTARRVRETLELAAVDRVEWRDDLYYVSAEQVLAVIAGIDDGVSRLLVVGHNPATHYLADRLAADDGSELRAGLRASYPTASLALLDMPLSHWNEIGKATGSLAGFVRPGDL